MLRFIINAVITAVVFCFVFPEVNSGIQFHGQFWPEGVIYAGIFSIVASLVGLAVTAGATLLGTLFTVATRGVGLLLVVPALLIGLWFVPAIQLEVFAHYFPAHFTVASWGSAVWGGLILMLVNALTANWTHHANSVKTSN